jgi:hypothetical protein
MRARRANPGGVLEPLAQLEVTRVIIKYDGYGDEGTIESVDAIAINDQPIDLPKSFEGQLTNACLILLPCGWENNEGAYGELVLDVQQRRLTRQHNWRVESSEYEMEDWTL